jgi:hypothetical protein
MEDLYGTTTLIGKEIVLDKATVTAFKNSLSGELICPEDEGYEQARKVWNGMINKRPAMIARCRGVADVVQCVKFLIILHCSMFPKLFKLLKWGHENASPGTRANPLLASIGA